MYVVDENGQPIMTPEMQMQLAQEAANMVPDGQENEIIQDETVNDGDGPELTEAQLVELLKNADQLSLE